WNLPRGVGILFCFGVVLALSVAMDWLVFRPLRTQSPAVMLVATFAVAFLLQSIALLAFGPLGKIASALAPLNRPVTISGHEIRKIALVSIVVAAVCLLLLQLLLTRPPIVPLAAPLALVVVAALVGTLVSQSSEGYFVDALVKVSIVVALSVFIGNSGVLSFGHISFVALGAWLAGVLAVPVSEKPAIMPSLAHALRDRTTGNLTSLLLAALVGGICAFAVGLPLMRLSGLAAGIATFG